MAGKESVTKLANNEEKKKALDAAIAKLEKDFGKGAVMRLGESGAHVAVETVPTGCLSLDLALGLGGVPKGRVIEVYGPESSGKTTVALHMISEVPVSYTHLCIQERKKGSFLVLQRIICIGCRITSQYHQLERT